MSYADACDFHATAQGLDPITAALRAGGVPHSVDQTGGFTMCINVPIVEGGSQYLYLTDGETTVGEPGAVAIGRYWECENWHSEGDDDGPAVPLADVVEVVRAILKAGPRPCPYCEPS